MTSAPLTTFAPSPRTQPPALSAGQIMLAASRARAALTTPSGVFELRTETFGPVSSPQRARDDRKGPPIYGTTTEVVRTRRTAVSTATTIVTGPDGQKHVTHYPATRWRYTVGELSLTYAQLQKLPTNPSRLAHRLAGSSTGFARSFKLFDATSDLLMAPAPPQVQAAAWRMLATVPDVIALGHVRDPLRRAGLGVRISYAVPIPTSPDETLPAAVPPGSSGTPTSETLILSVRDGRLLATEIRFGGGPVAWTAVRSWN
jgi:hypothetical protein